MIAAVVLLVNNWQMLTVDERKVCRDVFNDGLLDAKPEVQSLAKVGMTGYLVFKPFEELASLAAVYSKNCIAIAEREKRRRKLATAGADSGVDSKPDKASTTTIMMTACVILAFPYDLPEFTPQLLCNLSRHAATPALKETVTRAVQDFKRTHSDRWEEFKARFTADQLEDLQGAGAMSYYS